MEEQWESEQETIDNWERWIERMEERAERIVDRIDRMEAAIEEARSKTHYAQVYPLSGM